MTQQLVSIETLEKYLLLSRTWLLNLVREGVLPKPVARGQYDLQQCVNTYISYLKKLTEGNSGDLLVEKTRLIKSQADKTELEVEKLKNKLVDIDKVENCWATMVTTARAKLLTLPLRAAPLVTNSTEQRHIETTLTNIVHEALQELATKPINDTTINSIEKDDKLQL